MEDQKYPVNSLHKDLDIDRNTEKSIAIRQRFQKTPSFIQQIQRIQQQRSQLSRKALFRKSKNKGSISGYLKKKLLIPSTLRINASCQQIINVCPHIVQLGSYPPFNQFNEERKKQGYVDFQINQQKDLVDKKEQTKGKNIRNQDEKWRMQMSAQEINCFLYGKDMRVRKRWLTDKKIYQLKSLHSRKRSKSIFIPQMDRNQKKKESLQFVNRLLFRKVRIEKQNFGYTNNCIKLIQPQSQTISLKKLRSICHANQYQKMYDQKNESFPLRFVKKQKNKNKEITNINGI